MSNTETFRLATNHITFFRSVHAKVTVCLFILFYILCKVENIWIHADSCVSSTELPVHLYLRTECHADLYMTVFVFLTELMESAEASKCISFVLFIKPWFYFFHTQTWETVGERDGSEGGRRRARRDTKRRKRDINRSHTKTQTKRIDGIRGQEERVIVNR